MDFNFKLSSFITQEITVINNTLVPENFAGDRRNLRFCVGAISEILDDMGIASAKAQGLLKPITSADKLRNSEHIVYLLTERESNNHNGSVIGMLKMGRKRLYVFDKTGECHEMIPLCVLDFYVHESRQRMGCGKKLFEYMLNVENIEPEKLAIDRPSDKFLFFLRKHYGLKNSIPQTNNYVVFEGFFPRKPHHSGYPLSSGFGNPKRSRDTPPESPYSVGKMGSLKYNGRHTAHKPESTVGKLFEKDIYS
uniref:Alpha-tubulin N-acetyltransferase n=1 Tax=Rhodnius prolixus TaxID=13249 RepID=T1HF60_RHOPR